MHSLQEHVVANSVNAQSKDAATTISSLTDSQLDNIITDFAMRTLAEGNVIPGKYRNRCMKCYE